MILYLTADDAGASIEVNERIDAATRDGYVNSVSVLVNTEGYGDAVARFARRAELRKSLHLNLVEGVPLALDDSSPLVTPTGFFKFQAAGLMLHYLRATPARRRRIQADIRTEWAAQIRKFSADFETGRSLNIDSHQHLHVSPFAVGPLAEAFRETGLRARTLRLPDESVLPRVTKNTLKNGYLSLNLIKYALLRRQSRLAKRNLLANHREIFPEGDVHGGTNSRFCGVLCTTRMTWDACQRFLDRLPNEETQESYAELLLHPGGGRSCTPAWAAAPPLQSFYSSTWRDVEFQTACDPRWDEQKSMSLKRR